MGCCVSTDSESSKSTGNRGVGSKSPPPTHPVSDEETVKEVLSETPTLPKRYFPIPHSNRQIEGTFVQSRPALPDFSSRRNQNGVVRNSGPYVNDLAESSEIRGDPIETASISTAGVAENGDYRNDDGSLEPRRRSPARSRNLPPESNREKSMGLSPGRRSELSPNRPGSGYTRKRESGETSGRRSRSPITRTEPAAPQPGPAWVQVPRKTGKSPVRAGSDRARNLEEERGDNGWAPTGKESLENPLVSLECFIFL